MLTLGENAAASMLQHLLQWHSAIDSSSAGSRVSDLCSSGWSSSVTHIAPSPHGALITEVAVSVRPRDQGCTLTFVTIAGILIDLLFATGAAALKSDRNGSLSEPG